MARYSTFSSKSSSSLSKSDAASQYTKEYLLEIAHAMKQCVIVRDRKFRLKIYENCFTGTECIDFLVEYLQLERRKDAVKIAQHMNNTLHFCEHVTQDHKIKDENLFYRFTNFACATQFTLVEVMRAFQRGVPTEDRTYRLRTYQKVFVGSEAVDWMIKYKFAPSRAAAVELGNKLAKQFELFTHVTNEHELKDDYIFYRMLVPQNVPGQVDQKEKLTLDKKALQLWIAVFFVVGMIIYYSIF